MYPRSWCLHLQLTACFNPQLLPYNGMFARGSFHCLAALACALPLLYWMNISTIRSFRILNSSIMMPRVYDILLNTNLDLPIFCSWLTPLSITMLVATHRALWRLATSFLGSVTHACALCQMWLKGHVIQRDICFQFQRDTADCSSNCPFIFRAAAVQSLARLHLAVLVTPGP